MEVAGCSAGEPARASRHIRCWHEISEANCEQASWLERVMVILDERSFDLVIPATDAAVCLAMKHRRALTGKARFYLPSSTAFETFFNKRKTVELAASLGVPVPRAVFVPLGGSREAAFDLAGQVVVKPLVSVSADNASGKHFARICKGSDEVSSYLDYLSDRGLDALVQEYITGSGVGVEVLADRGEILFAFEHLRLHETIGFGSSYRQSVALDSQLLDAARKIVEALGYSGVAMMEFRVNPSTGDGVLLEVNGRFWGSLPLTLAAGADFPWYLYQLLTEGRRSFAPGYRIGVRARNLSYDVCWLPKMLAGWRPETQPEDEGMLGWETNSVSRWQLVREFARFVTFRDRVDTFSIDDPKPLFTESAQLCRSLWRRVIGRG